MFNKKILLSLAAGVIISAAYASSVSADVSASVPYFTDVTGLKVRYTPSNRFEGILTDVSNTGVTVVNFEEQKVINAFVPQNQLQSFNGSDTLKTGKKVRIQYTRSSNGMYFLQGIKKLED